MVPIGTGSIFGLYEIQGVYFDVDNHITDIVSYHRICVCGTIIDKLCDCFFSFSSGVGLLFSDAADGCNHSEKLCVIE